MSSFLHLLSLNSKQRHFPYPQVLWDTVLFQRDHKSTARHRSGVLLPAQQHIRLELPQFGRRLLRLLRAHPQELRLPGIMWVLHGNHRGYPIRLDKLVQLERHLCLGGGRRRVWPCIHLTLGRPLDGRQALPRCAPVVRLLVRVLTLGKIVHRAESPRHPRIVRVHQSRRRHPLRVRWEIVALWRRHDVLDLLRHRRLTFRHRDARLSHFTQLRGARTRRQRGGPVVRRRRGRHAPRHIHPTLVPSVCPHRPPSRNDKLVRRTLPPLPVQQD
mmetsp:Transcript_1901/g.6212  ORF Transcript_1901/g.6212 Transcript_1901/m.6212 type:complete len:272 (+) Transcript_1901:134-949(+)